MFDQKETASGYLFYVNRQTGQQQNDNPQVMEIMQVIHEEHNSIKYITYRCATKIWLLKQSFYTVNIPYSLIKSVLTHHGFTQCDNVPVLKPRQLIGIIHDIYFAAYKCDLFKQSVDFHLKRCTSMLANFFWSIYDPYRKVPLSLLIFRQLMLLLCNTQSYGQLTEEEFDLVADPNRCVNRFRFDLIINAMSKFFSYIGENTLHGPHLIASIIQECFEESLGMIGLSEYQFIDLWLQQNIKFSCYTNVLALVYRIKESQNIVHEVECVSCKQSPIVGIRFKCKQCRKLSLCYECFCTGYYGSRHELSHRMYEISTNLSKHNVFSSTFSKLGKCFCFSRKKKDKNENDNNVTMEIKVTDDKNGNVNTTIIECVNDTKWNTPRKIRPIIEQTEPKLNVQRKVPKIFQISPIQNDREILEDELNEVLNGLAQQVSEFQSYLTLSKRQRKNLKPEFLSQHQLFLGDVMQKMNILKTPKASSLSISNPLYSPKSSTPYQSDYTRPSLAFSTRSQSTDTIYGARFDRPYSRDNRSDYTLVDVSTLPRTKSQILRPPIQQKIDMARSRSAANLMSKDAFEAEMENFTGLLNKIRLILDDSNSENKRSSFAAKKFEKTLDKLIESEDQQRICYV